MRHLLLLLCLITVCFGDGLNDALNKAKKFSDEDGEKTKTIHLMLVGSAGASAVIGLITLIFLWWYAFEIRLTCYQRLNSCKEKLNLADAALKKRVISEELIGKLSHVANFDLSKNQEEMNSVLKSVYPAETAP